MNEVTAAFNAVIPLGRSGDPGLEKAFIARMMEVFKLFCLKQADYGPRNIGQAGQQGVAIRLNDKVQRLLNLLQSNTPVENESLRDTWMDIADYGIIGLLLYDMVWPIQVQAHPDNKCPHCGRP